MTKTGTRPSIGSGFRIASHPHSASRPAREHADRLVKAIPPKAAADGQILPRFPCEVLATVSPGSDLPELRREVLHRPPEVLHLRQLTDEVIPGPFDRSG